MIRKNGSVGAATTALRAGLVVTTLAVLMEGALAQSAATFEHQALDRLLGTTSIEMQPLFSSGQLDGCTMIYSALARDWTYKQGSYIKIDGSFGLMSTTKGQIGISLKVVLHDINPRTMSFTPSAPASAYFVSGNKTTKSAVVGDYPSDTPGAIIRGA